ncbi:MAG: DUF1800 domain-containing protein [Flavobacterium sp.]|nr:DUF1800 domain-containing protein [Flavobacterium sp.]
MHLSTLNALRLGFSTKAADTIQSLGLENYITQQLQAKVPINEPDFIAKSPKSLATLRDLKQSTEKSGEEVEKITKTLIKTHFEWKAYLVQRFDKTEVPLREKINLFFQNHFVVTSQSVKVPFWIYQHYETIVKYSLSNYKTLVKEMVYTNAMIKYLDNHQNRKGKTNENLAREVLELFTLGEGNYSENDIKNIALSLTGLTFGEKKGMYRPFLKDNSVKTVFGKSGNFDIDEVIDIIFEQPHTPYFLAEKVLKWFFYDDPPDSLITKYGDILKKNHFELSPFFYTLFKEECQNPKGGNQIKNPLIFFMQIHHDLQLQPNYKLLAFLLKNQAMDLYDQPNVKGWKGGKDWLTAQIYADRNQFVDFIIDDNERFRKMLNKRLEKFEVGTISWQPNLHLKTSKNAKTILEELAERMVFETNETMQTELNQLLKYDFDPHAQNAKQSILRVYQYLAKSPEFQII